jgi:hypothetical protein
MQAAGVTDKCDVRLFLQRQLQVSKDADPILSLDVAVPVNLHSGSNHMGKLSDAIGKYLNVIAKQRA